MHRAIQFFCKCFNNRIEQLVRRTKVRPAYWQNVVRSLRRREQNEFLRQPSEQLIIPRSCWRAYISQEQSEPERMKFWQQCNGREGEIAKAPTHIKFKWIRTAARHEKLFFQIKCFFSFPFVSSNARPEIWRKIENWTQWGKDGIVKMILMFWSMRKCFDRLIICVLVKSWDN